MGVDQRRFSIANWVGKYACSKFSRGCGRAFAVDCVFGAGGGFGF